MWSFAYLASSRKKKTRLTHGKVLLNTINMLKCMPYRGQHVMQEISSIKAFMTPRIQEHTRLFLTLQTSSLLVKDSTSLHTIRQGFLEVSLPFSC